MGGRERGAPQVASLSARLCAAAAQRDELVSLVRAAVPRPLRPSTMATLRRCAVTGVCFVAQFRAVRDQERADMEAAGVNAASPSPPLRASTIGAAGLALTVHVTPSGGGLGGGGVGGGQGVLISPPTSPLMRGGGGSEEPGQPSLPRTNSGARVRRASMLILGGQVRAHMRPVY